MPRPFDPWVDSLPIPVVALDATGTVTAANAAGLRRWGGDLMVGRRLGEVLLAEPERGGLDDVLRLVATGVPWSGQLRLTGRPGAPVAEVTATPTDAGAVMTLAAADTTAEAAATLSDRLTRLARVATELQSADDLQTLTDVVVSHLADAAGATTASLAVLVDDETMVLLGLRGGTPDSASRWASFRADDSTPVGAAIVSGQPVVLIGREEIERRYPNLELAAPGERSMLCLPLRVRDRSVGAVGLSFPGRRELDAAELEFHRIMADTCALALERIQAQTLAAKQLEKLRFLSEASEELATSLDYEATLRQVAWLAVTGLADWCTISLEQDGVLRPLAVAHRDPQKVALAEEYQRRYPPEPGAGGAYEVLRTGESLLIPEITDEMLTEAVTDPEQLAMIRELDLRSALTVALQTRGRIVGTAAWVNGESGRRFGPDDVAFGEDFARRAAMAIDNALLHTELRDIADRLQSAVRPRELPALPGWQLAASYTSAGRVDVGGDFYDAIPLAGGRLGLLIGDVMGRGVEAAAAMSQVLAAARAFAAVDPDPATVLERLDLYFERFPTEQLVTLAYAVIDPRSDRLTLANAGHPAPLLIRQDGTVEYVEEGCGTILGVERSPRSAATVPFAAGDTLVLFTDGLLERRGEDPEVGKERLLRAWQRLGREPTGVDLSRLVAEVRESNRDDDVAVLSARRR